MSIPEYDKLERVLDFLKAQVNAYDRAPWEVVRTDGWLDAVVSVLMAMEKVRSLHRLPPPPNPFAFSSPHVAPLAPGKESEK